MSWQLDAAGANTAKGAGEGSVMDCLTFPPRPTTPPEIAKYRRSTALAPGQRYQHYGVSDDFRSMNLSERTFGAAASQGDVHAAELINHHALTELQRINIAKSEKVYRGAAREPLGRTVDRHITLPSKFTEGKVPFGCLGKSSMEPAKDIIFPQLSEEQVKGDEIYKRSHGNFAPGEQRNRGYKWHVDPTTTRFGVKGDTLAFNGVSKNIADVLKGAGENPSVINTKKVEDFRNMSDILGKTKNLGQDSASRPFDTIYGKGSASGRKKGGQWGAAEVIKGKYTDVQQMPDHDLGKSITPGFRNISFEDRAYGCPSIRSDLPAGNPNKRSLADSQNYGDDVPAQDLINPPTFSDLAIDALAMSQRKTKAQLVALFAKIGFQLEPAVSDALFVDASAGSNYATINAFRDAVSEYVAAVEEGREREWRELRRVV